MSRKEILRVMKLINLLQGAKYYPHLQKKVTNSMFNFNYYLSQTHTYALLWNQN